MTQDVIIGTAKKLLLTIKPIDGIPVEEYLITVEYFCSDTCVVTIPNDELIYSESEEGNVYVIPVYTEKVGCGKLKCRVIVQLPDDTFEDTGGYRTEIYDFVTGLNIVNGLK